LKGQFGKASDSSCFFFYSPGIRLGEFFFQKKQVKSKKAKTNRKLNRELGKS